MKHISMQLLFAAALALASASAARAFTYESTASGDSGMHQNYTDPDEQMKPKAGQTQRTFNEDGGTQTGGFSMQFGGQSQSFDQKYNSNDYFDPMKR